MLVCKAVECRIVRCKVDRVCGKLNAGNLSEVWGECEHEEAHAPVCILEARRGQGAQCRRSAVCLLFLAVFLRLQELIERQKGSKGCQGTYHIRYLHQAFCSLKEVLATLRLRALLVPVDDCLIRHTVLVIQDLQKTRRWF